MDWKLSCQTLLLVAHPQVALCAHTLQGAYGPCSYLSSYKRQSNGMGKMSDQVALKEKDVTQKGMSLTIRHVLACRTEQRPNSLAGDWEP